jgi:manganese/zinc/iron transport system permease protein
LEENILKTMHHLAERDGRPRAGRSMSEIRELRAIPTRQLRKGLARLTRGRYVERESRETLPSWKLTRDGVRRGARVTRLHRLWEVYLTEYLQIASDHVHDDAETIEHVLTPELEAELEVLLQRPTEDPHSRSIPYI